MQQIIVHVVRRLFPRRPANSQPEVICQLIDVLVPDPDPLTEETTITITIQPDRPDEPIKAEKPEEGEERRAA